MCLYLSILVSVQGLLQQEIWQMRVINKSHCKGIVNPNYDVCTTFLCQFLGHPHQKFAKLNILWKDLI